MKRHILIFFILLYSIGGFSQPSVRFKRFYDLPPHFTSESHGVVTTNFGYVISGITIDTSVGFGYNRLTLFAVDTLGDSLWVKNYGNPNFQYARDYSPKWMIKKGNNLFLTCPVLKPGSITTSVLIKFDMNGDTLWQKEYSGIEKSIVTDGINSTPDSGFIISGWIEDTINHSIFLLKTDSLGNEQWRKKINTTTLYSIGAQVIYDATTDKYVIVGSYYPTAGSAPQSFVIITDNLGNKLSQFSYNSSNGGSLADIIQSTDNNFIACGLDYTGLMIGSWQKMRSQAVKFDINGTLIWQKKYGVPSIINYFSSIGKLPSGDLILGGEYDTIYNYGLGINSDFKIQKTSAIGDSVWSREISLQGMNAQDSFRGFDFANDGGFVASGFFPSGPSPQTYCLVKLDSFGCETLDCQLVGIEEETELQIGLKLYPNPSANQISIEFELTETKAVSVELKNVLGQKIKTISNKAFAKGNNKIEINVSELSNGLYFIQVRSENKSASKKFIKN